MLCPCYARTAGLLLLLIASDIDPISGKAWKDTFVFGPNNNVLSVSCFIIFRVVSSFETVGGSPDISASSNQRFLQPSKCHLVQQ